MNHHIECTHVHHSQFTIHQDGHTITVDSSEGDQGPRPKALMLSAMAGCTGFDIVSILDKMRVKFSNFKVDAEAELSEEHPKVYTHIHLIYHIQLDNTEDQKNMEKAVALSLEKYCGVYAMMQKIAPVTHTIQYL